jgi:hypothetical protein
MFTLLSHSLLGFRARWIKACASQSNAGAKTQAANDE